MTLTVRNSWLGLSALYYKPHSVSFFRLFFPSFYGKAHRFQGVLGKLYTKLHIACTRIYFIGIRAFTIENERITLETMDKERLGMALNCRENLVLSTAPVHLQLDRLRKVADDDGGDHDVPGVAVVKFEACEFTCEGLISSE